MTRQKKKNKETIETMESKNTNQASRENIYSDVLGSYTGITEDHEKPIQDADDL